MALAQNFGIGKQSLHETFSFSDRQKGLAKYRAQISVHVFFVKDTYLEG